MKKILMLTLLIGALCSVSYAQDITALSFRPHLNNAALNAGTDSLNKRLGDLRRSDKGGTAIWGAAFYDNYRRTDHYQTDAVFKGYEGGLDIELSRGGDNRFFLGLSGGYMTLDNIPSSDTDAVWGGIYGTWLWQDGWFLDANARVTRLRNEMAAFDDKDKAEILSFSLEGGKEFIFDLSDDTFFKLEPKVKGLYGYRGSETLSAGGYEIKYNAMHSAFVRAGLMAAAHTTLNNCMALEPYIESGYNYDFSPDAKISDNTGASAKVNLNGGSWDAGGGLNILFGKHFSFYSYAGYEKGNHITNRMLSAGLRFAFAGAGKHATRCCNCAATVTTVTLPPPPPPEPAIVFVPIVKRGETLRIGDSYFNTGSAAMGPHMHEYLKQQSDELAKIEYDRVIITGHTDSTGSAAFNQTLSEKRAKAVADYLIEQGVPAEKVAYRGMGENDPIESNDTIEGRKLNRRVEIKVE